MVSKNDRALERRTLGVPQYGHIGSFRVRSAALPKHAIQTDRNTIKTDANRFISNGNGISKMIPP